MTVKVDDDDDGTGSSGPSRRMICECDWPDTKVAPADARERVGRMIWLLRRAAASLGAEIEICFERGRRLQAEQWWGGNVRYRFPGAAASPVNRLSSAFEEGAEQVVLIDAHCAELHLGTLREAFERIDAKRLVLGPATGGGCYLVGCAAPLPEAYAQWHWRSETACEEGQRLARRERLQVRRLARLNMAEAGGDVLQSKEPPSQQISVIIPVRNAAASIERVVTQAAHGADQIVVIDAGSTDETVSLARRAGGRVLQSPSGRAAQMNAGAAEADGGILLFARDNTALPGNFAGRIRKALADPQWGGGAFRWRCGRTGVTARWHETLRALRLLCGGGPLGDQALFVRREHFFALGGFDPAAAHEDRDFVCRLRRRGKLWLDRESVNTVNCATPTPDDTAAHRPRVGGGKR